MTHLQRLISETARRYLNAVECDDSSTATELLNQIDKIAKLAWELKQGEDKLIPF